jgi:hypothetical protein
VAGAAFLGYGGYLCFTFQGGTYLIFFKAFIVPVLLIVQFVRPMARRPVQAAQPSASRPAADSTQQPVSAGSES